MQCGYAHVGSGAFAQGPRQRMHKLRRVGCGGVHPAGGSQQRPGDRGKRLARWPTRCNWTAAANVHDARGTQGAKASVARWQSQWQSALEAARGAS